MKKIISLLFISAIISTSIISCEDLEVSSSVSSEKPSSVVSNIDSISLEVEPDDAPKVFEGCENKEIVDGWVPTWCEEFNYEGKPDESIWNYQVGGNGWGNGEHQYYTKGENVEVKDGFLHIIARKEKYGGKEYTSSRINTSGKADFKYGRFDIRAKLPRTRGSWPAIWMMPTKGVYGGWPRSGEIDIMEHSATYALNHYMGTIHTKAYHHSIGTQKGSDYIKYDKYHPGGTNLVDDFHVYSIIWEPGSITWLFDDYPYYKLTAAELYKPSIEPYEAWPFDQEFHFLLNVAIGGGMGGSIDPNFSVDEMVVDYVHVYQKDYVTNDKEAPSGVKNIRAVANSFSPEEGNITWDAASDDMGIKQYHIYVNGVKKGTSETNMYRLTNLNANTAYNVTIIAQDYAGNLSPQVTGVIETPNWPADGELIDATKFIDTRNKNMQLQLSSDLGGGYHLAYLNDNDYFRYKVNITQAGTYRVQYRVSSENGGGKLQLRIGTESINTTNISSTGSWSTFTTVESMTFEVDEPGEKLVTILIEKAGLNLKWFKIIPV